MSENKYIIDKDSLTGIADAVRDKLGTGGEATIDETTGEIVYPEGKGYYLKENPVAKFNMGDCSISAGHYRAEKATYLTVGSASDSTEYNVYFQKPFYSATLSFTHFEDHSKFHSLSVNGVEKRIHSGGTQKFTFSTPQSYLIIKSQMQSDYGDDTVTYQNLTATLFDEVGGNIGVKTTSIKSYDFLTEPVPEKIPFSIDDINNNISTYLTSNAGGGGTLETWNYLCTQRTYVSLPSDFSIENLKDVFFPTGTYQSGNRAPCGLYKDSVGKPVSLKDQGIALPSSYNGMNSPVTQEKIVTAYNEGRIFSVPWVSDFGNEKIIPNQYSFCWILVEPADSTIYLGTGRYINYSGIGYWTVVYTK